MLCGESFHQFGILLTLIVSALGQLPVHLVNSLRHLAYIGKSLLGLLLHGGVVLQYHDLWQIAYSASIGHSHLTFGWFLHAA